MMTKAFLVCNQGLFLNEMKLLDNKKLWYDETKSVLVFPLVRQLKNVKLNSSKAKTVSEKSKYNKQIKQLLSEIEVFITND